MMDQRLAKVIIHRLGSFGTPPDFGLESFSVGFDRYLDVITSEYLQDILKLNLSSFKLVTGNYGGGKTHFLYLVRDRAWQMNYVTSYVSLSAVECPFDRLELVYKRIAANLSLPVKTEQALVPGTVLCGGVEGLLRGWYRDARDQRDWLGRVKNLESMSYTNAVKAALMNLSADDEENYAAMVQWLQGEDIPRDLKLRNRIAERIDRTTAFRMLRSLIQLINMLGYSGLILLFDEAERGMSISSARDRRRALDNLRQIIDECGNSRLPGAMFLYAVPDENLLLEGSGGTYEALKQRLRSNFTRVNPMGVKINLEEIDMPAEQFLTQLGAKLAIVFQSAYAVTLDSVVLTPSLESLVAAALELQVLDVSYRRLFVVAIIEMLQRLRQNPVVVDRTAARELLRVKARQLSDMEKASVEQEEF